MLCARFIQFVLFSAVFASSQSYAQVSLSWLRIHSLPGEESIDGLVLDSQGSATVAGTANGGTNIMKYDRDGNVLWFSRYEDPRYIGNPMEPHGHAVDSSGSLVLIGSSNRQGFGEFVSDTRVMKYSRNGELLWSVVEPYPGSITSASRGVAVDGEDNVWIVGTAIMAADDRTHLQIQKFDSNGTRLWQRLYDGPSGRAYSEPHIALDPQGYAYIACNTAGRAVPGITLNSDWLVMKYSPDGALIWERRLDGPVEGSDSARCIAYDPRGYIVVGGYVDINPAPEEGSQILALARFTTDGDQAGVWMNLPNDQLYHLHRDYFRRLAIASDGSVGGAAAHYSNGAEFSKDITVVRFDPDFNFQWLRAYNTVPDESGASDVLFDAEGNVYGCGQAYKRPGDPNETGPDALVLKYSPEGNLLWSFRWNHPVGNMVDTAHSIELDSRNNVVAGGGTQPFPNGRPDFLTFKLCQIQGDADRNGRVDGADIELVIECFGLPGDPETASGDLNGDGIVDDADLAIVLTDFGKLCRN